MPIYEFKCQDCGHEFEELVFATDELPPCPKCSSAKTGKLMSACCARVATGGGGGEADAGGGDSAPQYRGVGSGCAGCAGGNCSTCGS